MNRKAFLATITAVFAAPLINSKGQEITIPETDKAWLTANPALLHGNTNKALKVYVDGKEIVECKPYVFTSSKIKGSDLFLIQDKEKGLP